MKQVCRCGPQGPWKKLPSRPLKIRIIRTGKISKDIGMANLPKLTADQVRSIIPAATDVEKLASGGQKLVFRGTLYHKAYALKFALLPAEVESEDAQFTDVATRAAREVEIMRSCSCPYMVKLGPIGLTFVTLEEQNLLYFSEEFITGSSLKTVLATDGPLPASEIVRLGVQIASAIQELWQFGKIHRDIKPANIMRSRENGDYVLLDAGLAFDVAGDSLSAGFLVGTPPYFSPEQFDYSNRRILDFRSDMFSLGVTLYEMGTGQHPFWSRRETSQNVYTKITTFTPQPPSSLAPGIPEALDRVIMRMLGKFPHLRYRRCEQLISALEEVRIN
jgi:serine/threonine protein kinase